jgi:hypothetical protein
LLDAEEVNGILSTADERWRRLDQRAWRTGLVPAPAPWQAAARAAGAVTVGRSFATTHRWLWLQWSPLVSAADARAGLAAVNDPAAAVSNPRAEVELVRRRVIEPAPAVAGAEVVTAREDDTTGPEPVHTLSCAAGRHLLVLSASGDGWQWPDVVALAELQLSRLPG